MCWHALLNTYIYWDQLFTLNSVSDKNCYPVAYENQIWMEMCVKGGNSKYNVNILPVF